MNSSVLNRISCHHYKRQIAHKTSCTPTGSLIRRLKYFFCFILEIFLFDKNFLLNSQCGGDVCCLSRCFPREAVCFCLFLVTKKLSIIIHSPKMYRERSRLKVVLLFPFHLWIYLTFILWLNQLITTDECLMIRNWQSGKNNQMFWLNLEEFDQYSSQEALSFKVFSMQFLVNKESSEKS